MPPGAPQGEEMKNALPYYKRYPRDFIEGTIGLDLETKGGYAILLDLIYMQGGQLADDGRYISGLLGCKPAKWNRIREALLAAGKIIVSGGKISNSRANLELNALKKYSKTQSENASGDRKNNDIAEATASLSLSQPEPEPEPIEKKPSVSKKSEPSPRQELEAVLDGERAGAVIDHRQRIRKPLTGRAAKMLAAKFAQCPDPNAAADYMILQGWQGFEPDWMNRLRQGSPPGSPRPSAFREHQDAVKANLERAANGRSNRDDDGQPAFDLGSEDYRRD